MNSNYGNLLTTEEDIDSPIQEGFLDDDMDIPLINSINIKDETMNNSTILCPLEQNQNQSNNINIPNNNIDSYDESTKAKSKMILAAIICFIFMVTEFIGGYIAGSLAIMTDAAHLTSDCISFLIGIASIWISKKPPDHIMSFGYKRIEIFGAVTSILAIWFLTAFLVYLAVARIITNDFNINANSMMIASSIGIFMNISMAVTLHGSCFPGLSHSHSHSHHNHSNNKINNDGKIKLKRNNSSNSNNNSSNHLNYIDQHQSASSIINDIDTDTPIFVAKLNITKTLNGTQTLSNNVINSSNPISSQSPFKQNSYKDNYSNIIQRIDNMNETNINTTLIELSSNSHHNSNNELHEKNLNLRAAIIHVIGDFIQSIGVFIASIIIKLEPDAKIADPICTIFFSFLVILTTIKIMKESIHVLLNAVPQSLSIEHIEKDLKNLDGIKSVHQLNVWSMSINYNILTVHLIIDNIVDNEVILKLVTHLLKTKYNIKQTTIQIEKIQNNDQQ